MSKPIRKNPHAIEKLSSTLKENIPISQEILTLNFSRLKIKSGSESPFPRKIAKTAIKNRVSSQEHIIRDLSEKKTNKLTQTISSIQPQIIGILNPIQEVPNGILKKKGKKPKKLNKIKKNLFVFGNNIGGSIVQEASPLLLLEKGLKITEVPKIKEVIKKREIYQPPNVSSYKFILGPGNNGELVRKVLMKRDNWVETSSANTLFNFIWKQENKGYHYERVIPDVVCRQLMNHFEFHREISTKSGLIENLSTYCEQNKLEMAAITPTTFILDLDKEDCDTNFQNFLQFYYSNLPKELENLKKPINEVRRKFRNFLSLPNPFDKKTNLPTYSKPKMHKSFLDGTNYLWLLKPTGFNRGRGIQIFTTLDQLDKYINEYYEGVVEKTIKVQDDNEPNQIEEKQEKKLERVKKPPPDPNSYIRMSMLNIPNVIKSHTFVIQKYIERPFLIRGRKFDIRVWTLVTHNLDVYFFKEGYLRTSCEEFNLSKENKDNHFIHLTNNAVQKYSSNYGCFENGNQLSFEWFQNYLDENKININFKNQIVSKIKEGIYTSMSSVKKKLNQNERKFCFEIFGYDFIIDSDFHTWLIEVNTNPCLEESSPLLAMLIPRMLDDAFKLTLDVLFPKLKPMTNNKNKNNRNFNPKPVKQITEEKAPITSIAEITNIKENEIVQKEIDQKENIVESQKEMNLPLNQNESDQLIENKAKQETISENKTINEITLDTNDKITSNPSLSSKPEVKISTDTKIPDPKPKFSVLGYSDEENLWDLLGSIAFEKTPMKSSIKKS